MVTVTAAAQLHPVEGVSGENLSGTMTETEIGTVLTVMLLKEMKSFEIINMGTSEITSMDTSGTTSTETTTIERVERGKDQHRTSGIATRGTIQGMVAGNPTDTNRAMDTVRRGKCCLNNLLTVFRFVSRKFLEREGSSCSHLSQPHPAT